MNYKLILFCGLLLMLTDHSFAQIGLEKDSSFLRSTVPEYQSWLKSVELDKLLKVESHTIRQDKFTLDFRPNDSIRTCDHFQSAWDTYNDSFNNIHAYKKTFGEKLMNVLSILTELHTDSLEIFIQCIDPTQFKIRIYGDERGRILVSEERIEKQGRDTFFVVPPSFVNINTGERLDSLSRRATCGEIRNLVGDYLLNHWYKGKGTNIRYNYKCDTTYSRFLEFTWEFTHISNEVLKDQDYYEYHIIHIKVNDRKDKVDIVWDFSGEYGRGILYPPKKNDYRFMEDKYPNEVVAYQAKLFSLLEDYLNTELSKK